MKLNWKTSTAVISFAIAGAVSSNLAFADGCDFSSGGVIANAFECADPSDAPVAKYIDELNGHLGQPIDHLINGLFK